LPEPDVIMEPLNPLPAEENETKALEANATKPE